MYKIRTSILYNLITYTEWYKSNMQFKFVSLLTNGYIWYFN